jgi:transcriptional regulator with XRE-family HTH domain
MSMTNLRDLLAKNIKKRRKFLGISQAILAEKADTSPHYIAQIEQRKKFPSSEMLERIAKALSLDSPDLFATKTYKDEVINKVQDCINADLDTVKGIIIERISELKKCNN